MAVIDLAGRKSRLTPDPERAEIGPPILARERRQRGLRRRIGRGPRTDATREPAIEVTLTTEPLVVLSSSINPRASVIGAKKIHPETRDPRLRPWC